MHEVVRLVAFRVVRLILWSTSGSEDVFSQCLAEGLISSKKMIKCEVEEVRGLFKWKCERS